MRYALLTILFGSLTALAACGGNDSSCTTTSDCFQGEVCVSEVCVVQNSTANNGGTSGNNQTTTTTSGNNATSGTTGNNGTTGGNNNTSTPTNNTELGICEADPFTAMCVSDDNDTSSQYVRTETGRGCLGGGDDFEGGTYTLVDQEMCARESVDKFNTNLIPCDSVTFIVEVIVAPKEQCLPDDWDLNVSLQGNDCLAGNGKMRCEVLPDGSKRATGFLEPSNSVTSPYITITSLKEFMQFSYDLTITVRE